MSDSTQTPLVNEQVSKTVEANLAEAKQAIESIEAQLLEVKSCIRSVEAVQDPPMSRDVLRALCRKFYVMGAEDLQENSGYSSTEFCDITIEGDSDGLSWTYNGDINIDRHEMDTPTP